MWQNAYVAASVLVGERATEALESLDAVGRAHARALGAILEGGPREARAKALAVEIAKIARAADEGVVT